MSFYIVCTLSLMWAACRAESCKRYSLANWLGYIAVTATFAAPIAGYLTQ